MIRYIFVDILDVVSPPNLKSLSIADNNLENRLLPLFATLACNTIPSSVEYLDVRGNAVCDRGAALLTQAIVSSESLVDIRLSNNGFSIRGWKMVASAVSR